jgi:hypothetical protein
MRQHETGNKGLGLVDGQTMRRVALAGKVFVGRRDLFVYIGIGVCGRRMVVKSSRFGLV